MSKLATFFICACDDYNLNLIETRYTVSTKTGLVDTLVGLENSVDLIFETIKKRDLIVQVIIFKDPTLGTDHLKINLPHSPKSGFIRVRPLSSKEREDFCVILHKKISKIPPIEE